MGANRPTKSFLDDIRQRLESKHREGAYRTRYANTGKAGPRRVRSGRGVLSFCSNDYLGLASDARVIAAFRRGAEAFGVGTGAACLINGYTSAHCQLEEKLADFTGRDRALLFSTGYMANLGVGQALASRHTFSNRYVLEDRLNHASLIDAAVLSRARLRRYAHADPHSLRRMLHRESNEATALVASDAVFSMDGDIAPLAELAAICKAYGAILLADDAHGFGVLGARGAGTLEQQGLSQNDVPVMMATFGKACGTFGAFVAGSEELIEWLIQEARTYIYTTAPPPAIAYATLESLRIIERESWRRIKLRANIAYFRRLAQDAGLRISASSTPIQPLIVGPAPMALALSAALAEAGVEVIAIRPPSVPEGTSRLRITLSVAHSRANIARLVDTLDAQMRHAGAGNHAP